MATTKKQYKCRKVDGMSEPTYVISYDIMKNGKPYTVSQQTFKQPNETKTQLEKRVFADLVARYGQPIETK